MDRDARGAKALQLVEDPRRRVRGPQVALRSGRHGRRAEAVGVAEHREHDGSRRRRAAPPRSARSSSIGSGRPVRSFVVSSIVRSPRSTARPRSRPSRKSTSERREAAVRRAEEGEELAPGAVAPGEAEQREERLAERGRAEPRPRLDRDRDARASRTPSRATRASGRATGRRPRSPRARFRPRTRSSTASATSSSVARRPAPSRKRIEPSSGAGAESSSKTWRSRWASPGGR